MGKGWKYFQLKGKKNIWKDTYLESMDLKGLLSKTGRLVDEAPAWSITGNSHNFLRRNDGFRFERTPYFVELSRMADEMFGNCTVGGTRQLLIEKTRIRPSIFIW